MPPKVPNFRAAFVIEIVAKIFQKAPNLVTLSSTKVAWKQPSYLPIYYQNSYSLNKRSNPFDFHLGTYLGSTFYGAFDICRYLIQCD